MRPTTRFGVFVTRFREKKEKERGRKIKRRKNTRESRRRKTHLFSFSTPLPPPTHTRTPKKQRLSRGNILRWDWWIWVFAAVALCAMPCLALASGAVGRARGALLAWATAATVLCIVSADRQYNISSITEGAFYSSSRTAFSGFLLTAAAGLALMYHFGVRPSAREDELK